MADDIAVRAWDAGYASGRYSGEPPVGFTEDIVAAATDAGADRGSYIGCGNGRNYIPLTEAGLDLTGLDISATAISQLAGRLPGRRDRLVTGDLSALPPGQRFPLVVAIQVMQHGTRAQAHALLDQAHALLDQAHALLDQALAVVAPGGLFAIRVNAVGTDVQHGHELTERDADGCPPPARAQRRPHSHIRTGNWRRDARPTVNAALPGNSHPRSRGPRKYWQAAEYGLPG